MNEASQHDDGQGLTQLDLVNRANDTQAFMDHVLQVDDYGNEQIIGHLKEHSGTIAERAHRCSEVEAAHRQFSTKVHRPADDGLVLPEAARMAAGLYPCGMDADGTFLIGSAYATGSDL